jgi:L-lactate dehydrogenase complex protein LldG
MKERAEFAHATVTVLEESELVPGEVARFLRDINAPATIRMGDDPHLAALPWAETALSVETGRSLGSDLNAVSLAFGAVAESGTLALVSGAANPTTLNFLPDNHVVVVLAQDLAGDYETIFDKLREDRGPTGMPRTLNFITGPSRSGDIEQTLILGAHGPRRLHVIIVR